MSSPNNYKVSLLLPNKNASAHISSTNTSARTIPRFTQYNLGKYVYCIGEYPDFPITQPQSTWNANAMINGLSAMVKRLSSKKDIAKHTQFSSPKNTKSNSM